MVLGFLPSTSTDLGTFSVPEACTGSVQVTNWKAFLMWIDPNTAATVIHNTPSGQGEQPRPGAHAWTGMTAGPHSHSWLWDVTTVKHMCFQRGWRAKQWHGVFPTVGLGTGKSGNHWAHRVLLIWLLFQWNFCPSSQFGPESLYSPNVGQVIQLAATDHSSLNAAKRLLAPCFNRTRKNSKGEPKKFSWGLFWAGARCVPKWKKRNPPNYTYRLKCSSIALAFSRSMSMEQVL